MILAKNILDNKPKISRKFNRINEIDTYELTSISIYEKDKYIRDCIYSSIERFPIIKENKLRDEISDRLGIFINIGKVEGKDIKYNDILITAPRHEFKENKILMNKITKREYMRLVEDPLAIQLIDGLGVGIHSKWGEEANYNIFNK